jgi:hypothetical protein
MITPQEILAGLGALTKIVPVVEAIITDIGPGVATLGTDAVAIVNDISKLLNDVKANLDALKASAVAAAKTPPAA